MGVDPVRGFGETPKRFACPALVRMDFELDLDRDIDLTDSLLVVAFPTTGVVGPIAASYLVQTLELEAVGYVHSDLYPAATIVRDGRPSPPIRVFAGEETCGPEGDCSRIVVLVSEVPPPDAAQIPLSRYILDRTGDARHVVALEGMEVDEETEPVEGIASTAEGCSLLDRYDIHCLSDGVVTGLAGALLNEGLRLDREVLCLVGVVDEEGRDSRAAARVVEALDRIVVQIDFDADPLLEWADEEEDRLKARIEKSMPAEAAPPMYG